MQSVVKSGLKLTSRTVIRALVRRGAVKVSKPGLFLTGLEGTGVALKGVDLIIEYREDGRPVSKLATPENVRATLESVGLPVCDPRHWTPIGFEMRRPFELGQGTTCRRNLPYPGQPFSSFLQKR
jgi:hypothetical protein